MDAVFERDRSFVRLAAEVIAGDYGWKPDWINDGIKGFLSHADSAPDAKTLLRSYPSGERPGLRALVATPAYLFAMKCLAMRIGAVEGGGDIEDIRRLGAELDIQTLDDAVAVVTRYYPADALPPKTYFGLEEIFGKGQ